MRRYLGIILCILLLLVAAWYFHAHRGDFKELLNVSAWNLVCLVLLNVVTRVLVGTRLKYLTMPFGVAINRCDVGDESVRQYCRAEDIDILIEIPDDRRIAEAYSRGVMAVDALPEYEAPFCLLYERILQSIQERPPGGENET